MDTEYKYNGETFNNYVNAFLNHCQGSAAAIAMLTFALVAMALFVRWGWKKRSGDLLGALLFLALAALVFITRALVSTFFNDVGIRM
jgi:hypothetical protein